jgi:hypothetical protein
MSRYSMAVLAHDPVAYFPLNEPSGTVFDLTGHGYVGTCDAGVLVGSAPFAVSGPGKLLPDPAAGGSFHDAKKITLSATLGPWPLSALPHSPAPFTYEAWLRIPGAGQLGTFWPVVVQGALNAGALPQGSYLWAAHSLAGPLLRLELRSASPLGFGLFDASLPFDQGWHHFAATWDGSNAVLYYDCTVVPHSTNLFPQGSFTATRARIGGVRSDGNLAVEYAHVALYDYVLTPEQIVAHCAATVPPRVRATVAAGGRMRQTVLVGQRVRLTVNAE